MGIPDHLTCLLRNWYASQEATVRIGHGTTDWFQIMKGVCQGCILSPCLFDFYAAYIMRNAGLDEAQDGIKTAGRNINNLRYADGEGSGTPLQCSCLENPMDRGAWWAAVHGVAKSRTRQSDFPFIFTFMHWRRKWQPTPVFLPRESQGRGSLVGCRLWGHTESDTTEVT